jgi:hypothetical protein
MEFFSKTVCVKQWLVFVMLGASGFAIGPILAKITTALGF